MWEGRTEEEKEGGKEGGRYECHQLLLAVQGISTRFSYGRRGGAGISPSHNFLPQKS